MRVISKEAIRQVLKDYSKQYSDHKIGSIIAFLMPAVGNILVGYVPPLIIAKIINTVVASRSNMFSGLIKYIFLFAGLWYLGEITWRLGMHFLIKLEVKGVNKLSKDAFLKLSDRDYEFYANNFVGSLSKKAFAYSRNFELFTDTVSFNIISNIFPLIFVTIILWRYSFWLPLILLIFLTITILVALPMVRKRSLLVSERHDANSKMVGRMSDSITNIMAIKSFAKEKEEARIFGNYVDDFTEKFKKASNYHNLKLDMAISPLYVITNTLGLLAAIYFTQKLNLQPGATVVIFSYYAQITRIFWEVNRTYRHLEAAITESAEFSQMFLNPPVIRDIDGATELRVDKAEIEFDEVNFNYVLDEEDEDLFLSNFSLKIEKNQKIGLVGPSGGGKTTITKLLLRFIDPQSGRILIDGQEIGKVTQSSLREAISFVPQEPLLFHRSLEENIAYGNPNASKKAIIEAAKLAHAHDFIKSLSHGYDTLVGERGIKLSGGQRQRIAIARALLKKAPILVLDEATSSLDSESEKYIQEGLWELMKDKTALVIAHRLSTIKHLDRIIVLENGEIVQDGTHEELVKQKGLYAKLWGHQSGENDKVKVGKA